MPARAAVPSSPKMKTPMRQALSEIVSDNTLNPGVLAMREREAELGGRTRATLVGAAVHAGAREHMDRALDAMWASDAARRFALRATGHDEVIVGGGLHAAIYAAVRVAQGYPRPLILEQYRIGGAMAYGRGASFYLNSRNRPGTLSVPGSPGALNVLPGAPLQPADLSADEYQRSGDLAYVIRATIAMNAEAATGMRVVTLDPRIDGPRRYVMLPDSGGEVHADRVIYATGLGAPRGRVFGDSVLAFDAFMDRMAGRFPLRGVRRVAVVGAGDSGKTVVEALTGQGPPNGMTVASLDRVEAIDWYGVPLDRRLKTDWERCSRSRYAGIGRLLPRGVDGEPELIRDPAVIRPLNKATEVQKGWQSASVDSRPYDLVIDCRGFGVDLAARASTVEIAEGRRGESPFEGVFAVGPCADLDFRPSEVASLGAYATRENRTALFRWAPRTAALASRLRGVPKSPGGESKTPTFRAPERAYAAVNTTASSIPF